MAGIITHLITGTSFLEKQKLISAKNSGYFMLGSCFPDATYWPGEDSLLSDLSHYILAAKIPQLLYQSTSNESWKVFALGWLFHLQTDISLHPLVNKFAAKYYYGKSYKDQIYTYEDNQYIHALIENGLDRRLLRINNIGKLNMKLPDKLKRNPISEIIEKIYLVKFSQKDIDRLLKKLPGRLKLFYKISSNYEKKRFYKFIINRIVAIVIRFTDESIRLLLQDFVKPYKVKDECFQEYQEAIEILIEKSIQQNEPQWFEQDYNFDTGRISEKGEYDLVDNLFYKLERSGNDKSDFWVEFGKKFLRGE